MAVLRHLGYCAVRAGNAGRLLYSSLYFVLGPHFGPAHRRSRDSRRALAVLACVLAATLGLDTGIARAGADGPGPAAAAAAGPAPARVSACFVPARSCAGEIVAAIAAARQQIRVQAYGFTAPPILSALAAAKARGVDVQVILDKSNDRAREDRDGTELGAGADAPRRPRSRYSGATYMAHAGVPVWIDDLPAIAHNKLIIIDRHLVIGGSYNYTQAAERRNAENVTLIDAAEVAEWFLANWNSRRDASRRFEAQPPDVGALGSSGPLAAAAACAAGETATCRR